MSGTLRTPQLLALIQTLGYTTTHSIENSTFAIWNNDYQQRIGSLTVDHQGAYNRGTIHGIDCLSWPELVIELQNEGTP